MAVIFRHALLPTQEQQWIQGMINEYPYPVLVSKHIEHEWIEKNLSIHSSVGEDCMGGNYIKQTHMYGIVKTSAGPIYFFLDKGDYDKVCALDFVIDPQPFMTFMEGTIMDKIFK